MAASRVNSDSSLGFLTAVEDSKHGLFGGYLVLNRAGRPLEFHCTAPIRPNRAQEILYGPTLRPYLYGEQIGRTLLEQGKQTPAVVLTDCEPMLSVGEFSSLPIVLVGDATGDDGSDEETPPREMSGRKWRIDAASRPAPSLRFFVVRGQRLAVRGDAESCIEETVVQGIEAAAASLDLAEPFERIRAAIDEARRGGPSAR